MSRTYPPFLHLTWPLLLSLYLGTAGAQIAVPDAGSLRQQIEQQRELPLPPVVRPPRAEAPPPLKPQPGLEVSIKRFSFTGNSLINGETLAAVVAGYLNRPLGFDELQRATNAVAGAYREAGWIARVYLPEQDVSEGTVTLQVVEARYGGQRIEGPASQRVRAAEIEAYFQSTQTVGEPLRSTHLDRSLLLVDDLPGVSVAGTLVPGKLDGETDLVLRAIDEPFSYGDIGLDNHGARSTGSQRLSATLSVNSLGGRGELINAHLLHSKGSDYARLSLNVPDGTNGLRLGFSLSHMTYKVVGGPPEFINAGIQGRSSSIGIDANYPVLRTRMQNLYFSSGLENKRFYGEDKNKRDDPESYSDYESASLRMGLSGNRFDELGGGGANSASLQMLWGRLHAMEAHRQLQKLERSYRKISYSLSRQQNVAPAHSLMVSLSGQRATQVLDSSEKFYIGGPGSVRAYPVSELGGESGQVFTGEWRWRLNATVMVTAFADAARVVSLPLTPSDQKTALDLRGRGLSLSWQGPMGISTRLVWSTRNGQHPKPTLRGTDGDGSLRINRYWLNLSVPF